MVPYFCLLLVIFGQWIMLFPHGQISFNKPINKSQKKVFIVLTCLELIFFAGLRSTNIGADTAIYLKALNYYKSLPHDKILNAKLIYPFDFEIGYFILTKICAFFSFSNAKFLFLIACLIYIPVFKFIYDYSENPFMSTMTYLAFGFFGYSLGIFRQMIAISICLMGFKYVLERKLYYYIIFILLAMTFHTTAIIMLPMYWLNKINLENKFYQILFVEATLFIFARKIVNVFIFLAPKYTGYVGGMYDIHGGSYTMLFILNILFVLSYRCYMIDKTKFDEMSIKALVVAMYLQVVSYSMQIFGRIVPYYSIYMVLVIPCLIRAIFKKNVLVSRILLIILFLFIFYILTQGNANLNPYEFIV